MTAFRKLPREGSPFEGGLLLRALPPYLYAGRARMLLVRSALASKNVWLPLVSGFFEPVLYLVAMGHGLGSLVGVMTGLAGQQLTYAAFIAPGLLAASAMNGAVYDTTLNFFFKLKYGKVYDAILASPLGPLDVALGEIGWALIRSVMYSAGFLVVMLAAGLIFSPWALLALPVLVLVAFAFAAVGMAATSFMRSWQDFDFVQLAVLPMLLFSATFFPLSVEPLAMQWLMQVLPLYHAVALMRGLTTGVLGASMLGHVAYFLVLGVIGTVVALRRLTTLILR